MQQEDQDKQDNIEVRKELSSYVRYSGMGFQMIAVIGIFMFIGYKIDQWLEAEKLLFTAIFGMLGVCASLYLIIRSLKNKKS
jgi:F0F1-type ATP synthase assembly protein I